MKKKIIYMCILFCCLFNFNSVYASNEKITIEYLSDGSYYETILLEHESSDPFLSKASSTKKGEKTVKYVDSKGVTRWKVSVIGTFTYNSLTSKCTKSEVTATSYDNNWKIASKNATKSNNVANASATAKNYYNGNLIATITKKVSLQCSKTGVLS